MIYGVLKDCYKEPIRDAVVKLIEVCGEERKPVSHTFTDKEGEFVFGPLCPDKFYEINFWVDRVKHIKVCAKCEHEGKCLKGEKIDKCDCFVKECKKHDEYKKYDEYKKDNDYKKHDECKKDDDYKKEEYYKKDDDNKKYDDHTKEDDYKKHDECKKEDECKKHDEHKKDDECKCHKIYEDKLDDILITEIKEEKKVCKKYCR